jgi:hypothetical protein
MTSNLTLIGELDLDAGIQPGTGRFLRFNQSFYGIEPGVLAADGADAFFGLFK